MPDRIVDVNGNDITEAVEAEIEDHKKKCGCSVFNPDRYRAFRRSGFAPAVIGYEGCKIFIACDPYAE
jgi:hypothetical protein